MKMQSLPHMARIWVPYDERSIRDELESDLALVAGGWTSYQATGGWRSDLTGAILKEIIVVYEVAYDHVAAVPWAFQKATDKLLDSQQESVLIEIDGLRRLYRK